MARALAPSSVGLARPPPRCPAKVPSLTGGRLCCTVGAFFVVFGITVLALAARPAVRTSGVVLAVGNALFSVLTVVVVLADVWPLTTTGVVLVLGTGVYTLVMAELQYQGVRRITRA